MIGDWFSYKNTFHRVDALRSRRLLDLVGYTGDNNHHLWVMDEATRPIRLTDTILTVNGWKGIVYESGHILYYIESVADSSLTMEYILEHNCFWFENIRIEFVHELQHVLRLCGFTDLANEFRI